MGSQKSGGQTSAKAHNQSPGVTMVNQNRIRRNPVGHSPVAGTHMSEGSHRSHNKSVKSSGYGKVSESKINRTYNPGGGIRNTSKHDSNGSQNRMRREGAVVGSMYANDPKLRLANQRQSNQFGRLNSGNKRLSNAGPASDRSKSNKSDNSNNSNRRRENRSNMISNAMQSKFVMNTRAINHDSDYRKQREVIQQTRGNLTREMENVSDPNQQNIDDKINKL